MGRTLFVNIKRYYLVILIIILLLSMALYSTYAMFTASIDTNEFVNLSASNIPTDTSMLEYERLIIDANSSKIIDLNISNRTSNSLYYGIWYEMIEPSTKNDNIVIAKYASSSNETFGSIASSVSNKVTIIVNNKTSDSITINIGVAYSLTNSLNLPLNRELVTGEYGNFNVSMSANDATIEGGTNLTNLITNGSFENTGWSTCSYNTTYKKYGNYSCALTGTTSTSEVLAVNSTSINLNSSHKYYSRVEAYQTSKTGTQTWQTYWPIAEPSFGSVTFGDVNKWNIYSLIADRNTFTSGSYQLRFDYDNRNNNGTVYYDGGMLLDLTESFGSGKEPTKEWLDNNINYFEGNISMKNDVVKAGNNITYTITPNGGYKLDKVTCDNGATASVNGNTITISNVSSDTKCNVNTVSSTRTSDEMLKYLGLTAKTGTPDFSQVATTDEGIYSVNDDYEKSYYFRGASTNNYVKFAGYYWRIVRINGNGTIRMIYDGATAHNNGESSTEREITASSFNVGGNYNAHVGYKRGTIGSSTYAAEHANTNDSTIKGVVDNWYKTNIVDVGFGEKVADVIYCNDRKVNVEKNYPGNGAGKSVTSYVRYRLYSNKSPILICSQQNDAFTADDEVKGNGDLEYPVGLITADEVSMAGGVDDKSNSSYYLYTGNYYWTMSPYCYIVGRTDGFYVNSDGSLGNNVVTYRYGVRPVISLKSDIRMSGTGSKEDPFVVS